MNFPRFLSCFFVVSFCLVCVNLSGLDSSSSFLERTTDDVVLRQHFWVFRELPPGVLRDEPYNPEEVLEKYALYIMQLSVFGGRVTYTPSDKTRGIEEFFEFIPRYPIKEPDPSFTLEKISYDDENKISAWASYRIDSSNSSYLRYWQMANPKKYPADGYGNLDKGLEGVFEAYRDGMKNALRNYARTIVKNKPREIRADICIYGVPRLTVNAGRYEAKFEVLIKIEEIIPYSVF